MNNLKQWAAELVTTARILGVRFGERVVFLGSLGMTDEERALAVLAHREGFLRLSRADYVAAMDPDMVAASEINVDGAEFHFVEISR